MNVSLAPELESIIRQRVEFGRYNNASEVVQDALRHLEAKEKLNHLRSLIQVGLDAAERGELVGFTSDQDPDMDREVEEAFQRGVIPDPDVCP